MADINAIADQIQGLTLLEASQLVKLLEEKLGVSAAAAAPVAVAVVAVARLRPHPRWKKRPNSRWFSLPPALTKSTSSKRFAKSPASA